MGKNAEDMIKKAISQTIVDEMFRELGFYVLRMGEEDIANPLTQLSYFIKKCGGNISINSEDIEVIRKMPDFCIISKEGRVSFVEVKFSKSNILNEEKMSSIFEFYPDTYILLVNLEIGDNLIFQKFGEEIYSKEGNLENMKKANSRFNIVCSDFDEKNALEYLYAFSLREWLKEEFDIEADNTLKRYEDLVVKWLKPKEDKTKEWIKISDENAKKMKSSLDSDFFYEVDMMIRSFNFRIDKDYEKVNWEIRECFLLHIRNLYEFFYGCRKEYYPNTAFAKDYIPTWNKSPHPDITSQRNKLNKFLSHLDYSRGDGDNIFDDIGLYHYFKDLTIKFLDELNELHPEYLSDRLKALKENLKKDNHKI